MIRTEDLSKRFGDNDAVDGLDLDIPAGEFFWLELHEPKFPISRAIADVLLGEGFRR